VIHPLRNIFKVVLFALLFALVVSGTAAAASAKSKPAPCWKVLINDWYDGRIDGTYPIHCYREALKHLPTDVDTYSSARDDIRQALQQRITQSHKKGGAGGIGGGNGTGGSGGGSSKTGGSGGGNSANGGGAIKDVFNATKPGSADSVPVPLIVLGAVALLLMVAGGAGFMARRMRTRKLQLASLPPASPEPRRPSS